MRCPASRDYWFLGSAFLILGCSGGGGESSSTGGTALTEQGGSNAGIGGSPAGGTEGLAGPTGGAAAQTGAGLGSSADASGGNPPSGAATAGGTSTGGSAGSGDNANSGGSSSGGNPGVGGRAGLGGAPGAGGAPSSGGTASTGGHASSSGTGSTGTGGITGTGGAPGGTTGSAGQGDTGGSAPGSCDEGSATTAWATSCPTAPTICTSGTWVAGGPDPDHSGFALKAETTHFAVYSDEDISTATAESAASYLEDTVWPSYFGSPMFMREPLCAETTKTKASIHVHSDWGLSGGAWSSTRMGMWIGTGGLNDHWGLAHEFMHAVQSVQGGMSCNRENTCGWIYESHANFAPHQLPEYRDDVHCSELMVNTPHVYLGSTRNRYCNWQFLEYLKDKYCYSAVNEIWTGSPSDSPFTAIMNGMGWTLAELGDFMAEWAMHNITWDYQNPPPTSGGSQGEAYRRAYGDITSTSAAERRLRLTKVEPLDPDYPSHRRFVSPHYWAPQRFGYNVVRLFPEPAATSVTVTFRGVTSGSVDPDFRWGLVATDPEITTARYSAVQRGTDGALTFCVDSGESLFLVVMATPTEFQNIVWDQEYTTIARYPYMIELAGAWPEGFQNGEQDACPAGLTRTTNGGGCAPAGTTAYVGPYATVLSGATVSGDARIEDHAVVVRGTVSGGTVGALTIVGTTNNAFTMNSGTAMTIFYPLGFFEAGQGLSGGTLIGDVEYRGQGLSRASGSCSGFVDSATCLATGRDSTPVPPYAWRD